MKEKQFIITESDLKELVSLLIGYERIEEANIYVQGNELNIDFEGFNIAFYTKTEQQFCIIF